MLRIVYVKSKSKKKLDGSIKLVTLQPLKDYDIYLCIVLDTRVSKSSQTWTCVLRVVTNNKINYSRAVNSQDQRVSTLPLWRMIDAKELKHLFEFKTHKYGGYLRQSVMETERYGWLDYSWSTPNSRSKREAQHSSILIPISQARYWSQPRGYCSHQRILKLGKKGGSV